MGYPVLPAFTPESVQFLCNPIPGFLMQKDREDMKLILLLGKMMATVTKKTAQALQRRQFSQFDPIVHENACQIRALYTICFGGDCKLLEEASALEKSVSKVEKEAQRLVSKLDAGKLVFPRQLTEAHQIFAQNELEIRVSERMLFFMQAHFLTASKVYQVKGNGAEIATISIVELCRCFGVNQLRPYSIGDDCLLKNMVAHCQKEIGLKSIRFIQNIAMGLSTLSFGDQVPYVIEQLADAALVNIAQASRGLHTHSTCAYFNIKAILLHLRQAQILIRVKPSDLDQKKGGTSHGDFSLYYRSKSSGGVFSCLCPDEVAVLDEKEVVFVVKGLLSERCSLKEDLLAQIEEAGGLEEMILNNIAREEVPQYGIAGEVALPKSEKACQELLAHRYNAMELGCTHVPSGRRHFTIVHTCALSVALE